MGEASSRTESISVKSSPVRYIPVPAEVIYAPDISPAAKLLFLVLWGDCRGLGITSTSQERLAEITGIGPKTVRGYLRELINKGWLRMTRPGLGRPNQYEIIGPVPHQSPIPGEPT